MQKYLLAALVAANFVLACESGSTTTATNDTAFVAPDTKVLNDTNGPTKPEPVQLGTYKVLRANWKPDEGVIGMYENAGTAFVTYQPAFEDDPATYTLTGDVPELTCNVDTNRKVKCPAWTAQDGTIVTASGEFSEDNATAEVIVDFHAYPGTVNEYHDYAAFKLNRN